MTRESGPRSQGIPWPTPLAAFGPWPFSSSLPLRLGDERFGIWSFLAVFVGYLALVDLGISPAVIKYVAEYYASHNYEGLNRTVNSALVAMLLLMGTLSLIGITFSRTFLHFFKLSPQYYSEAWIALVGFFILIIGQGCLSVFQGLLSGLQRLDVQNLVAIGTSIPYALSVVYFLHHGHALIGLIYANGINFALNFILTAFFVHRICPQYHFNPLMFDWKEMKGILHFGLRMQVNNVAGLVCAHGDKIMIGFFLTMAKVTVYELGFRLAIAARVIPSLVLPAVMPAAAEVHANNDWAQLQRIFELGTRYLSLFVFPSMTLLMLCAPTVMAVWLGESRPESILAARLLSLGFLVNTLGGVGTSIARGMGRPDIETRTIPLQLALNFGLGIPLILKIGFLGPLIATPTSIIAGTLYVFYLLQTQLHLSLKSPLARGIVAPGLGSLFACLITGGLCRYVSCSLPAPRWLLFCYLLFQGFVFLGSYLLFLWKFRLPTLEVSDWDLLKKGLNFGTPSLVAILAKLGWNRRLMPTTLG